MRLPDCDREPVSSGQTFVDLLFKHKWELFMCRKVSGGRIE